MFWRREQFDPSTLVSRLRAADANAHPGQANILMRNAADSIVKAAKLLEDAFDIMTKQKREVANREALVRNSADIIELLANNAAEFLGPEEHAKLLEHASELRAIK